MTVRADNFIDGTWVASEGETLEVRNPATQELLALCGLSRPTEVDRAVQAAHRAFIEWKKTPVTERIQFLFRLKGLLEEHLDELARTIVQECGKTFDEARGEMRRGIENVETACGTPALMQGFNNEDIARGIDEFCFRQPVGVVAAITPFNFPGMIPLWFLPYAVACGNCFILKPSERVPLTARRIVELVHQTGIPAGVVQLVNGSKEAVDALLDHPLVRAISFVGSSPVARYIYSRGAAAGKRLQCQGGAKNPIVVLPDADMEMTRQIVADSAFGCAGQRCLAGSVAVTVGEARGPFSEAISEAARTRVVGYGLEENTEMGPVISPESRARIEQVVEKTVGEGARVLVDGRGRGVPGYEKGNFIYPTILENVDPKGDSIRTEIFGPVLSMVHINDIEEAIEFVNRNAYGNMACLFTRSGWAARRFRNEAEVGNIGINLGVAAPMAFFPFSGWKESFFGDLHAQGRDAIDFYTEKKVVIERWPSQWSRRF